MYLPNFLADLIYVKPFVKQISDLKNQNKGIIYVSSDNDRNMLVILAYDNVLYEFEYIKKTDTSDYLEITSDTSNGEIKCNTVHLNDVKKHLWKNKYQKIKILKKDADICSPKEIIEKTAIQINIHKKYTQIEHQSLIILYKAICAATKKFCENNQLEVNVSMDLNRQNHWLD